MDDVGHTDLHNEQAGWIVVHQDGSHGEGGLQLDDVMLGKGILGFG